MSEPEILSQSYEGFIVNAGDAYCLRGTVLGNVEVRAGGHLIHEGCITEQLYVHAGANAYVHGMVGSASWERPSDVEFHGIGHPSPGWMGELPFTGPEAWGSLNGAWEKSVLAIEALVRELAAGEDSTEYAFRAAAATAVLTGPTDVTLWALLAAAVFNDDERLQLPIQEDRVVWCPQDCRERLPWAELGGYFDSPPEPFSELLPIANRAGRSLAFDYYEALSRLIRAVLAIGDAPPSAQVGRVEAFRAMLRQQSSPRSPRPTAPKVSAGPNVRRRPQNAPRAAAKSRRPTAPGASAGEAAPKRDARIRRVTDPVDSALAELDNLIGLSTVKQEVQQLGGFAYIERQRVLNGDPPTDITRHLVMTGNQGTGKTTVARLLGQIYCGYGLLERPIVHEVSRIQLVAGYVGQTALKVKEAFEEARGGVLFIDEAYALAPEYKQDFGQEAIDTLVPLMENHRTEIMVVVAGYPEPMRRFLRANPGLEGRFGQKIHFPNYTDAELVQILRRLCEAGRFELAKDAEEQCPDVIRKVRERMGDTFDNGRMVRRLFEGAVKRQHARLYPFAKGKKGKLTRAELRVLQAADLPSAAELVVDAEPST